MGYAISGGPYGFSSFGAATKTAFINGLRAALEAVNWEFLEDTTAYIVWTISSLPPNGRNVSIGGKTYTFWDSINNGVDGHVLHGATVAEMLANLKAAINLEAGAGTLYSTATTLHATLAATEAAATTLRMEAKTSGPDGNGITCTGGTSGGTMRATANSELNKTAYGGYKLRGRSPQFDGALTVGIWICTRGFDYAVALFYADYEGGVEGYPHPLKCGTGITYQVVATPCQVFVSRPGVAYDVDGSAFGGGVPYVLEGIANCCEDLKDAAPAVTEAWWSMGDGYYSPFFVASSLRLAFLVDVFDVDGRTVPPLAGEGCWNGVYTGPSQSHGNIRLVCLSGPAELEIWEPTSHLMAWGELSIDQDALLAWGDTVTSPARLRCQIWDSFIDSRPLDMDLEIEKGGRTWIWGDPSVQGWVNLGKDG